MITLSSVFACRSYRSRLRESLLSREEECHCHCQSICRGSTRTELLRSSHDDLFLSFFPFFFVFPLVFLLHCSFSLIEIDFTLPHRCHHLTTAAAAVVTVVFTVVVFPSIFFFSFSLSSFLLLLLLLLCPHGALKLESRLERRKEDR